MHLRSLSQHYFFAFLEKNFLLPPHSDPRISHARSNCIAIHNINNSIQSEPINFSIIQRDLSSIEQIIELMMIVNVFDILPKITVDGWHGKCIWMRASQLIAKHVIKE
jgi:hypothetical protein